MEAYGHLRVLVGMILGLAITRILSGLSRRVQNPEHTEGMFAQTVWAFVLLLGAVHFWWWEFALRRIEVWHFWTFVFVLVYTALHFLMATLLFPDALPGHQESEAFFMRRRRWFFGIFALSFGFDLVDTVLKGRAHLEALGPEYLVRLGLGVVVAGVASQVRSRRALGIVGLVWLAYDLSWIIRLYGSLD